MPEKKEVQVSGRSTPSRQRSPIRDLERMMETYFSDPFAPLFQDLPAVSRRSIGEIKETDDAFVLCADIPGVPKEDVHVEVNGNMLTIRAEHEEQEADAGSYRRQYRSFNQNFALPSTVDPEKIEANCENGVLEVLLPKTGSSQPKRVEVQSGKGGFLSRLKQKAATTGAKPKDEKH